MSKKTDGIAWGLLFGLGLVGAWSCGGSNAPGGGSGGAGPTGGSSAGGTVGSGGSASGGTDGGGGLQNTGGDTSGAGGGTGGSGTGGDGTSWVGCEEFEMPADCTIPEGVVLPSELRCTGLYSSWEERELRCGVRPYAPSYELWADGAAKQRYVWLPPGTTIDVSDPDEFQYPVGTRFWKEFHVGEEGSQKLGETRYLLRVDEGWLYTAYVWSEDGQTSIQNNDGVTDLFGSGHSVPSREQCKTCHDGRSDKILGWDFIMLGEGAIDLTLQDLADEGWLTGLDETLLNLAIPGDEVESTALGYLHANCGVSCHNPTTYAAANPSGLYLRLNVEQMDSPHTTAAVLSGVNHEPSPNANLGQLPEPDLEYYDFRPLDTQRSLVPARMNYRGSSSAMPPLGTHVVDPEGVELIQAWIESMTEERGYPAPAP